MTPVTQSPDTSTRLQSLALATALLSTMLAPVCAAAQEPTPSTQEPPPANANEPATTLPTVSVKAKPEAAAGPVQGYMAKRSGTATKTDTPIIETPQSISVITADRIDAIGAATLRDAMGYTPGVNISPWGSDPRYDNWIFLRGFDAYKPGFNLDGLPLRNNDTWGVFQTDNYGAERVEVLRGPASVLYGQGGPGGTVNVMSKRPSADVQREIRLQVLDPQRRQGAGDFTGPLSEDGNVLFRMTGLLREGENNRGGLPDDRVYLAPALTWNFSPDTTLTVLPHWLHFSTGTTSGVPEAGSLLPNPNGPIPLDVFTGEPGFDRFEQEQWAFGYQLEHRLNPDWTLRHSARYAKLDVDYQTLTAGSFVPDSTRVVNRNVFTSREDVSSFVTDNQAQTRFNSGTSQHTLLLGLDHQRTRFDVLARWGAGPTLDIYAPVYGAAVTLPDPPFIDGNVLLQQTGLYVQDQIKFAGRWSATLGARYDSASTDSVDRLSGGAQTRQTDHATTSRAGLVYLHPDGWAPYAGYSESFSPSTSLDPATGKPFKPETSCQYEAGVRYQPPNRSDTHTIAVFDLRRRNYVTFDASFVPGQTGEIQVRGLELESSLRPRPHVNLSASYAFTPRAIVTTSSNAAEVGRQLNQVPRHQASLWGDYRFAHGLKAGLGLRYTGSHRGYGETASVPLPDYTLVDALLSDDIASWSLALNVRNLADKVHLTNCSSGTCYFGDARRVAATATYRW